MISSVREKIFSGYEEPYEASVIRKDGSIFPVEIRGRELKHGDGNVRVVAVTDLTERKRLEEHLLQAQRLEAIGRLAGGVAHDFNNLLTVITGYAHMIAEDQHASPAVHANAEEIVNAGDRAARLCSQLLALGQRQVLRRTVFDLNAFLSDIREILTHSAGAGVSFRMELHPSAGFVNADAGQLEEVVVNLVLNARKVTPEGGSIVLRTGSSRTDPDFTHVSATVAPGEYAVLSVTDTGPAMTEEERAHLFEPFFSVRKESKTSSLALATTYGIIRQHGGDVWVSSVPGAGTTFKLFLPSAAPIVRAPSPDTELAAEKGGETILLVEDEEPIRRMVKRILEDQGYTVIDAADGYQALELFRERGSGVQLLITDVIMPVITGKELAERLREQRPDLAILYISGYTEGAGPNLQMGADFLQKPFTPDVLTRRVREALDRARA